MDGIRQYIVSAVAAGTVCAVVKVLLPEKGMAARLLRLVCGIFLTFTLLSPLKKLEIPDYSNYLSDFSGEGQAIAQSGEKLARDAMGDIIKSQSEAYILDKAQTLNASVTVDISLDEDLLPTEAVLTGTVSPYGKSVLTACMEELGIAKERQTWIG